MKQWLGPGFDYRPQETGNLGQRLARVVQDAHRENIRHLVMVGADIPGINRTILQHSFDLLNQHELVLGPAKDGGYYLIGLDLKTGPGKLMSLFEGIDWGSDQVLAQSVTAAEKADLKIAFSKTLQDVDRSDDITVWRTVCQKKPLTSASISVIIPAFNEERHIGQTIVAVQTAEDVEIIVADGGSSDRTTVIAQALGAKILVCPPSKARQMNLAAQEAMGNILCFLHADTTLPQNYPTLIRHALARPGVSVGAFAFGTDIDSVVLRRVAAGTNWRSKTFGLPYGDQAIFVKKKLFHQVGGYPEIPIMEDVAFVLRVEKKGAGCYLARRRGHVIPALASYGCG